MLIGGFIKDALPYEEFEMIVDFEGYLQNYMKERDERIY